MPATDCGERLTLSSQAGKPADCRSHISGERYARPMWRGSNLVSAGLAGVASAKTEDGFAKAR